MNRPKPAKVWSGSYMEPRSQVTKRAPALGGYSKPIEEAHWDETIQADLLIDYQALFRLLASKALKSKSGKAAIAVGCIIVKVKKRTKSNERVINRSKA